VNADLLAFLRARLDEDEADRWDVHSSDCATTRDPSFPCDCGYPARMLREVTADRELLMAYEDRQSWAEDDDPDTMSSNPEWEKGAAAALLTVIRLRAGAAYSDHPDYDPGWKP